MAVTFANIGLQEPGTISHVAATVEIARGSTTEQQEILCLGDPQSSLALAVVTDTAPASTAFGLVVRQVAPSTGPFAISSIAGRTLVDQNSTAWVTQVSSLGGVVSVQQNSTTWAVQQTNYSTTANVSSLAGRVLVDQNSTVWQVQLSQYSTTVNISSLAGTVATAEVVPDSTYASGTKASSGDTTIISSGGSTRIAVYGYHFSLASTTPTIVRLMNGSTVEMARWLFQGPSSMSIGANLAVGQPGYLYRTAASNPLILHTDSTATVHYAVQAFRTA